MATTVNPTPMDRLDLPSSFIARSESNSVPTSLRHHRISPDHYPTQDDDEEDEEEETDERDEVLRTRGVPDEASANASVMNRSRPKKAERRSSFYRAAAGPDLNPRAMNGSGSDEMGPGGYDFRQGSNVEFGGATPSSTNGPAGARADQGQGPNSTSRRYNDTGSSNPTRERRSSFCGLDANAPASDLAPHLHRNGSESGSSHDDRPTRYQSQHPNLQPASFSPGSYPRDASFQHSTDLPTTLTPLLDQSHLHPGNLASLLSHEKTLDLYRANAKKTGDPDVQFEFCTFVMEVVGELEVAEQSGTPLSTSTSTPTMTATEESGTGGNESKRMSASSEKSQALVAESVALLSKLANRGHVKSQYFLADCYTQGVGTPKNKRDFDKAYPLFVLAGKHGHPDACFRAAQCCENGWGCRKDSAKAVTFLRKSAMLGHPPAMHRLGLAEMNGELGLTRRPKEGLKWIKRAAELADQVDPPQPQSLHELAMLNEKGIDNVIFVDHEYAAELYARAAELGYAPSAYKLGECYEYGKMGCPQDSALSIHYYNIAAQQDHREACFALTAWYLVGSPGVLPQSDTEAYLWARKAAEMGLAKAEYAVGYFTEVGIGTHKHARDALGWFRKAADHGDKRAKERLRMASMPNSAPPPPPPQPRPISPDRRGMYDQQQQQQQNGGYTRREERRRSQSVETAPKPTSYNYFNAQNGRSSIPSLIPPPPSKQQQQQQRSYDRPRHTSPPPPSDYSRSNQSQQSQPLPYQSLPLASPPLPSTSDPYSRFYEPPLDTYGRPAPIERPLPQPSLSSSSAAPPAASRGSRQSVAQPPRDRVLQKAGGGGGGGGGGEKKGEDCVIS